MKIPAGAVDSLNALKQEKKFTGDPEAFYSGISDESLRTDLEWKINLSINDFIQIAQSSSPSKQAFLDAIKKGLSRIGENQYDTEDAEAICGYYQMMLVAVGMNSSEGILREWVYGF